MACAALGSVVLFRLLNRMQVTGLENIPEEHENVLYCLNHNSILDNFAFEVAAYLPKVLFRPEYLPVSLADRKHFFGDPDSRTWRDRIVGVVGRHFLHHLRAFPVDRKKGDLGQVDQWARMLEQNIVIVFPEGTRSRTGEIGSGKAGVGKLIYRARPTVIPVRMLGMGEVLGVGCIIPRALKTVRVIIGRPLDTESLVASPLPEDVEGQVALYRQVSERVIQAIKDLTPTDESPPHILARLLGRCSRTP